MAFGFRLGDVWRKGNKVRQGLHVVSVFNDFFSPRLGHTRSAESIHKSGEGLENQRAVVNVLVSGRTRHLHFRGGLAFQSRTAQNFRNPHLEVAESLGTESAEGGTQ
jgi:hypothetical protein